MKRFISVLVALVCLMPIFKGLDVSAESLCVSAKSAILIEAESGEVLYQKDAFTKRPMASTTKIMTALVAIEQGRLDRLVAVNDRAIGTEGSSIYLVKGEKLTLKQLLYSLMLASANDAATAIAYEIAGSIEKFAELMNAKASELGLKSTHFKNPHGLHDDDHYTTAYDLARLTSEALKNQTFLEICSTKSIALPMSDGNGSRYLTNHNKLLRSYKGCIGVKTGFTKNSGRCLVSAAERDGLRFIAVTLSAPDDWNDHAAMLDFGFSRYQRPVLAKKGELALTLSVAGGKSDVTVTNKSSLSVFLPKEHGEITYKTECIRPVFAPVKAGEEIGRIVYYENGREIASSALVAVTNVDISVKKRDIFKWLKKLFLE